MKQKQIIDFGGNIAAEAAWNHIAKHPPLFPVEFKSIPTDGTEPIEYRHFGVTMRTHIATQAMHGLLANATVQYPPNELADNAVRFADALIKRLGEKGKK